MMFFGILLTFLFAILVLFFIGFSISCLDDWLSLGLKEYLTNRFSLKDSHVQARQRAREVNKEKVEEENESL